MSMYPPQQNYPPQNPGYQQPQQNYPPQNPGYPQAYPPQQQQRPAFPPQPQAPAYQQPQQNYPPQAPAYPPQNPGYQQQAPAFPQYQQPEEPLPVGSLSAFIAQPKGGRPPAVSWKGVPLGTTVEGYVSHDVGDSDVVADTDPQTQKVKTWRDGRTRFVLVVTLDQPNGEQASLYCRGQLWDAIVHAKDAAGRKGFPKAGDFIQVTLRDRVQGRGTIPRNDFVASYRKCHEEPETQVQAQPEQPAQQAAPVNQVPQAVVQQAPAPVQQMQQAPAPVQQMQQAPAPQAVQAQPLPEMSAEQAAFLAKISNQGQ